MLYVTNQLMSLGRKNRPNRAAFTLTELLVTLASLALLLALLLPASAASRSQGLRCLDNLKQLMAAMLLYTADNHDFFPPNPDDGNTVLGHNWCMGQGGTGDGAEFNPDPLLDGRRCLITAYIGTNASLFRCPADLRTGRYQGTNTSLVGSTVPAARSFSMSQAVGTICRQFDTGAGHSGPPCLSVDGPWLSNSHNHSRNYPWRTYGKLSEAIAPVPAKLWVLIDEDAQSLNDGTFAVGMAQPEWIDWPSTRHDMAGTIAFADGRVELHKWTDSRTRVSGSLIRIAVPGSADWQWLSQRTSARAR